MTTTAAAAGTRRHTGTYPAEPGQVRVERAALAGWLEGWRRADKAVLIGSEFATNAVLHSGSRHGGSFTLRAEVGATGETMTALAHGDLIPGNILVDDNLHPLAVLDFGFLSTAADPAFDAAVTASVYDMYSPAARETERRIDEALISRFGYNPRRLALYRAAYAVITSTAYDPSGRDGHYKWCVDMLSRDSVVQVLDAAPQDV